MIKGFNPKTFNGLNNYSLQFTADNLLHCLVVVNQILYSWKLLREETFANW